MRRKAKAMTFSKAEKLADRSLSLLVRVEKTYCEFHNSKYFYFLPTLSRRNAGAIFNEPPCKCSGALQLCHKITRKNKALRYDRRNVFSGCSGSNLWAHYNQLEWDKLWRVMWPEDELYLTHPKFRAICKRSKEDLIQMATYFDREREKLK